MPAVELPIVRFRMAAYRPSGLINRVLRFALLAASLSGLAACGHLSATSSDRDCLARVMYFESIRSSDEGMLAVGTVVMNRVQSKKYPNTVCGVVGQANQFAPGALTNPMPAGKSRDRAYRIADAVLRGKRHRGVGKAMFFHTAGRTYGYSNMHYVAVAGGNAFYERQPTPGKSYIPRTVIAQAGPRDSIGTSRWPFGGGYDKPSRPQIAAPAAPVYVAAATPMPRAEPAYVAAPIPLVPPSSIEALILASNGY